MMVDQPAEPRAEDRPYHVSDAVSDQGPDGPADETVGQRTRWERIRLNILRVVAVIGAFIFIIGVLTACAGIYTSRPEFCRSCHNMEPYYASWKHSSHSHVSCIKCHFPPGAGEKIRGKMLGLVQLVKYVTSSEGPRPAAEVPDASCLRSGCHETRLLSGRVDFNGIPFDHRPHLNQARRGKKLRCTSCHSQIVQGSHMTVTQSTCFLCHFKEQQFNQGLGTCTRCHQIPEEKFDLGGGVTFDHEMVYQRNTDCKNCHGDLIKGNGQVPPERCTVCHNRVDDLARIGDSEFLHQTHVSDHKVDCLECHLEIHHSPDPQRIEHAASNCASCHPGHHQDQVNMLKGIGAHTTETESNAMVAARLTCPSCHQVKSVSDNGSVIWKASTLACSQCHDATIVDQLWATSEELKVAIREIEEAYVRATEAFASTELENPRRAELVETMTALQKDIRFLRVGNGIHNIHFAGSLTRTLVAKLRAVCRELKCEPPSYKLLEIAEPTE